MSQLPHSESPLQTVDRSLRLLKLFSADRPEWSVSDAARTLGISKSMVSRLFSALAARGFVVQEGSAGRFRLGLQLVTLGQVARESQDLIGAAHPVMRWLAEESGETAFLTVVDGDCAVTVDKVESQTYPIRLSLNLGTRWPLHAGASNKTLLAFLPQARIAEYLVLALARFTAITIVDADALRLRLAEIRTRGYDFSKGELTPGIGALGAPVFGPHHDLVAAVSISGPLARFGEEALPGLIDRVREAAQRIQRNLGYDPDPHR